MTKIIKDRAIVEDDWEILQLSEDDTADAIEVPEGKVIVPLKVWQLQRDKLIQRAKDRADIAIWFSSNEQAKELQTDLQFFSFTSRGFS